MRTDIHPKGCKTHDGIRTVPGCAVCRAERIEASLREMVKWMERARVFWPGDQEPYDPGNPLGKELCWCSEIDHDEDCLEIRNAYVRALSAISEEEGTPTRPPPDNGAAAFERRMRALSPSPATPSEGRCTECGGEGRRWPIHFVPGASKPKCPSCGGFGRTT